MYIQHIPNMLIHTESHNDQVHVLESLHHTIKDPEHANMHDLG